MKITKCNKQNLCVDCDNENCIFVGKLYSDCPKYSCDNKNYLDCENCDFMKSYQQDMRYYYKEQKDER